MLDLGAERARFERETASGFGTLRVERFDAVAAMFGERRPFDDARRAPPVPEIWQLHALTVGAALRNPALAAEPDSAGGKDVRDARQRQWELYATLATGVPPPDWKRWTSSALDVERYIHAGTAGVTDESYYARARAVHGAHARARAGAPVDRVPTRARGVGFHGGVRARRLARACGAHVRRMDVGG